MITDSKSKVWISGLSGLLEIPIEQSRTVNRSEWLLHGYPAEYRKFFTDTRKLYPDGEILVSWMEAESDNKILMIFKDGNWELLYRDIFDSCWLGHDNGFWIKSF